MTAHATSENEPIRGVYAYMTAEADTNITTAGTFYAVSGMFVNYPIEQFTTDPAPYIVYGGSTKFFQIEWYVSFSSEDAGRTVHFGISTNGETLDVGSPSVMGVYCKYADEVTSLSGTVVVELSKDDTIQLQVSSDADLDVITIQHFNTTIKEFFD